MRQGIHWGLIVRSILGRSKWWGGEEGVTKTTMLQPAILPEGGAAYAIFVKLCVQFILQALIAGMIRTLFYYSLWYVLSHPSHVRGLGLGLAF